jgi:hypothetical protein
MRILRVIFLFLLVTAIAQGGATGTVNPAGHVRGKKTGTYDLKVVGGYNGAGMSSVTGSHISITMQLKAPSGATGSVTFKNMPLDNDRFGGTASFNGTTLTLTGRVDMPAGTDKEQSHKQAITGRVTGNLLDGAGNGGRVVAIQDEASREEVTVP